MNNSADHTGFGCTNTSSARDGGTLMRDRVRYAVPFDFLVHKLFLRQDIERIFAYRTESLRRRFGPSGIDLAANAVNVGS